MEIKLEEELVIALEELEKAAVARVKNIFVAEVKPALEGFQKQLDELKSRIPTATPPDIRPEAPPGPGGPTIESIKQLETYLSKHGFTLINNRRPSGGGIWVNENEEKFGEMAAILNEGGIKAVFKRKGARNRYPGESYQIDPNRALPDE